MRIVYVGLLFACTLVLSCSKPATTNNTANSGGPAAGGNTGGSTLTAYSIDWDLSNQSTCDRVFDTTSHIAMNEAWFSLNANGIATLGAQNLSLTGKIYQDYNFYNRVYSTATLKVYGPDPSVDMFEVSLLALNPNFLTANYVNGQSSFSGACQIAGGSGIFKNISSLNLPLNFSSTADIINHTGRIRLTGRIFL